MVFVWDFWWSLSRWLNISPMAQALKRCRSAIWLHDGECGNGVLTDAEDGRNCGAAHGSMCPWPMAGSVEAA